VSTTAINEQVYGGLRVILHSSPRLHDRPDDDDRSGVTFWYPHADSYTMADLAYMFVRMGNLVLSEPDIKLNAEAVLALKTEAMTLNRMIDHAAVRALQF
jgi:hypothetical protein